MRKKSLGILFGLVMFLSACGGGGGGGGGGGNQLGLADLEGTWLGTVNSGVDSVMEMTLDGNGNITEIIFDGSSTGIVGSIEQVDTNGFQAYLSDSSEAMLMVDDGGLYMLFIQGDGTFAVLEFGATSLPTYGNDDILGAWSGFSYSSSDSGLTYEKLSPNSMSITTGALEYPVVFIDEDANSFDGGMVVFNTTYGTYGGYVDIIPSVYSPDVVLYVSPDKSFVGGYVGEIGVDSWPSDFTFLLLDK